MSRYASLVNALREAVLCGPARLSETVRQLAFEGADAGADSAAYLAKLRQHAHRITDEDIAALRARGWDDESIYEVTVAAAVGQGLRRLDIGLAALRAAREKHR